MSEVYKNKIVIDSYKKMRSKAASILASDASFLKDLMTAFNNFLGKNEVVSVTIRNAKHCFDIIPALTFDLVLNVSLEGRKDEYIINCTAEKILPECYAIFVGNTEYNFNTSTGSLDSNQKTLEPLLEIFCSLFQPHGELGIDL